MKEHISINMTRLVAVLNELRQDNQNPVATTTVIERYMGGFNQNRGIAPSISWNAQFGKFLMSNSSELGIEQHSANQKIVLNGSKTTTSFWQLNPSKA